MQTLQGCADKLNCCRTKSPLKFLSCFSWGSNPLCSVCGQDFGFSKIFTSESEEDIAQEASFGNIYVRGYDSYSAFSDCGMHFFATDKTYYKRSTGLSFIFGFCLVCGRQRQFAEMRRPSSKDKLGRPALYFKPGRDGFNAEPSGVKYLVYCLERVSLKHWCGSFSEMLWKLSAASRS